MLRGSTTIYTILLRGTFSKNVTKSVRRSVPKRGAFKIGIDSPDENCRTQKDYRKFIFGSGRGIFAKDLLFSCGLSNQRIADFMVSTF